MEPEDGLPPEVATALERLDQLVFAFEQHPEAAVQDRAAELLQCVDMVHRAGLRRLAGLLTATGLLPRALAMPEVRLLFDLYDLREGGDRARAEAVLETVRPYIESHGGHLEVADAAAGVVTVRLSGACHGCAGSAATLRHVIEQALRDGLPDFARMEVLDSAPGPSQGFVPLAGLKKRARPRLAWHVVLRAGEVPEGEARGLVVKGERVLVANLAGDLYAYRNACPGTPLPLDGGRVEEGTLRCPWHGCRFDLRGGKRLDVAGPGLSVMPIAVEGDEVRIGLLEGTPA